MINNSKVKEPVNVQDPKERIKNFKEVELGFSDKNAKKEAQRCLNCKAKPCVSACPVGVDIPSFISKIANDDVKSAYEIITKNNSFPAICGRVCPQEKQCELKCIRGRTGEPVSIGRLERYAADKNLNNLPSNINISDDKKHKIAVVGSGPSGLACASELLKMGFKVTIFEALHTVGGVLSYGIPEFRLPREILEFEVQKLKDSGAKIITNVIVGKSLKIDDLFKNGYKAVYIASGAGLPRFMNIPGEGLSGVYSANEFLTRINLMKSYKDEYDTPIVKPKKVLVIGGGNVAMDAARCAKRLGNSDVTVVYRRTENEMPARKDEILHAKEEGINFMFLSNPVEFFGAEGKVNGAKCVKMKIADEEESGRKSVVPIPEETFEIMGDTVIVAIGNDSNETIKEASDGINFDGRGRIITNPETCRTSQPFVYAGGDIVTGAATVILAMGAGKTAAKQIAKDVLNHNN
ncbi:MAG: NADPH-dependent glutamate synthase [Clostridia bacterium]|nr:NADPH-dependent glutamate synthase [Clostridia bacterium]